MCSALWSKTARNTDVSTGPLARSLAPLTRGYFVCVFFPFSTIVQCARVSVRARVSVLCKPECDRGRRARVKRRKKEKESFCNFLLTDGKGTLST